MYLRSWLYVPGDNDKKLGKADGCGADAVVLVTEWDAFRALDLARLQAVMSAPVLVDLRNIYDPKDVRAAGFAYSSIGRP